jgi:hypothetical protein
MQGAPGAVRPCCMLLVAGGNGLSSRSRSLPLRPWSSKDVLASTAVNIGYSSREPNLAHTEHRASSIEHPPSCLGATNRLPLLVYCQPLHPVNTSHAAVAAAAAAAAAALPCLCLDARSFSHVSVRLFIPLTQHSVTAHVTGKHLALCWPQWRVLSPLRT